MNQSISTAFSGTAGLSQTTILIGKRQSKEGENGEVIGEL